MFFLHLVWNYWKCIELRSAWELQECVSHLAVNKRLICWFTHNYRNVFLSFGIHTYIYADYSIYKAIRPKHKDYIFTRDYMHDIRPNRYYPALDLWLKFDCCCFTWKFLIISIFSLYFHSGSIYLMHRTYNSGFVHWLQFPVIRIGITLTERFHILCAIYELLYSNI